ncbi:MAG: excinuclease ABC subunit UvrB, partial [Candidatus Omnitrophica bacterium]|nr:excinuclease ABC subunit UvrB [Candidatus Omnitrophota bacterium]
MKEFKLVSPYKPCGDQPEAIENLTKGFLNGKRYQTLLGVTGSGKTFTMANVIANLGKPTLVISHNKTLAAQLYGEFREFFPENAVEYFVSYYDYYQPEAYVPQTDTYIEKDASINDDIDRLRLSATSALMSRRDVIIVASVSCIYNLGSPDDYKELVLFLDSGEAISIDEILRNLVNIYYERNDIDFRRGKFRLRGDILEVFPAYEETALRIEFSYDSIERISEIHPLTGEVLGVRERVAVYPAKHFVTTEARLKNALVSIEEELKWHLAELRKKGKLLEAQRLESRTRYDLEMLSEIGYCNGVENYSRHLSGKPPGSRPYCLIDYFPDDFLAIADESHVTIPQLNGMYEGDHSRKLTLVEYGFRLPSCLDNRPLKFAEFEELVKKVLYVSATPNEYEIKKSAGIVVEQIIRPTGLIDPEIIVRNTVNQIDGLIAEIRKRAERKERVLVTTLTKRMAEDLAAYLVEAGIRVRYIHSEIDAITRVEILRSLRLAEFDCLVGINLLREGLDLPEVSLVAVLDADKEGFLRSQTSLIQVAGRAARNINGKVIMYADSITGSMRAAIDETNRRRKIQAEYNETRGISPRGIEKAVKEYLSGVKRGRDIALQMIKESPEEYEANFLISELQHDMELAARNLQFEEAAILRDKIKELKSQKSGAS